MLTFSSHITLHRIIYKYVCYKTTKKGLMRLYNSERQRADKGAREILPRVRKDMV